MIYNILIWSEVWATLLPILVWFYKKPSVPFLKPVIIYSCFATVLYFCCNLAYSNIAILSSNHFLYNIISVTRLFLFMWFFALNGIPTIKKTRSILFFVTLILVIINFSVFDFFEKFSSTFTLEGLVLLTYCVLYFMEKIKGDDVSIDFDSALIIITGLAVYEAVCFFIFLFYDTLVEEDEHFAGLLWNVHNVFYIIFCVFIGRAFLGRIKENKIWV